MLHRGNCHCGAFVFEAQLPEIKTASQCNCAICFKKGYLWVRPEGAMKVVKDEGLLRDYTLAAGNITHKFCSKCGTGVMAQGRQSYPGDDDDDDDIILNARTLQNVDIWDLKIEPFDGAKHDELFIAPVFTGSEPSADVPGAASSLLYTGSCHCGAVRIALNSVPIDATYAGPIIVCNCSACQRGGYVWVSPPKKQVVTEGRKSLDMYTFGLGVVVRAFCRTCGVHLLGGLADKTAEEWAGMPAWARDWNERFGHTCGVNLRVLDHFDLAAVADKVDKVNGREAIKPAYVNP